MQGSAAYEDLAKIRANSKGPKELMNLASKAVRMEAAMTMQTMNKAVQLRYLLPWTQLQLYNMVQAQFASLMQFQRTVVLVPPPLCLKARYKRILGILLAYVVSDMACSALDCRRSHD